MVISGVGPTALLLLVCSLLLLTLGTTAYDDKSLSKGSREEQIVFWEKGVRELRDGELSRAYSKLYASQHALDEANKRRGWLFTKEEDKDLIKNLDEEHKRNMAELAVLKRQEELMLAKIKPLYGIVSRHFVQEQRDSIANAVSQVQQLSYDNAWYTSLFNVGDAETFTDLIVGFLLEWLVGYVLMYPFAALYYTFWTAPWSIYAYSSGTSDVVVGLLAWCASVTIMLLPLLALVGGFVYIQRKYGDRVLEALHTARERERRRR
ncbi:hypothetical protein DQ04_00131010 [Trypanosoma grayi]|uniref:hypothetical protein n=1 Tax=Trypanosoma grayi TaxID=71804 RepID=UPI0004F423C0|nr:hypothetical protein DQ04_00131010 [Trypanosoma grayi]KEG15242.1 hypothetical protein DQ04_00131010 [Trypanosoma grayi]